MTEKTDILLVQPHHKPGEILNYRGKEAPLGLAYLASYLEKNRKTAKILDLNLQPSDAEEKKLLSILKKTSPAIVGFTAFTSDIISAGRLASIVKKADPNILTVIGGIHATVMPEKTMEEFASFDILVKGQGEVPLLEITERAIEKRTLYNIPGTAVRNQDKTILNENNSEYIELKNLPFPARHKLNLLKYSPDPAKYRKLPNTSIFTSLGCPYRCAHCAVNAVHPYYNFRPPESVIDEIKYCIETFGITDFRFFDECLTHDRQRLIKLCNLIVEENLEITWNCLGRIDTVDYEMLSIMRKAGCYQITYGIENASEEILRSINKNLYNDQAVKAVKWAKYAGLETICSFMFGLPGEDIGRINNSINFAKQLLPSIATFYPFTLLPGSVFYKKYKGLIDKNNISWDELQISGPQAISFGISKTRMKILLKNAYYGFYFSPRYLFSRIVKLFSCSFSAELYRLFKGAFLVLGYFIKKPFQKYTKFFGL